MVFFFFFFGISLEKRTNMWMDEYARIGSDSILLLDCICQFSNVMFDERLLFWCSNSFFFQWTFVNCQKEEKKICLLKKKKLKLMLKTDEEGSNIENINNILATSELFHLRGKKIQFSYFFFFCLLLSASLMVLKNRKDKCFLVFFFSRL